MDPIADMFTQVNNALAVRKAEVILPLSRVKMEIARILKKEGYIEDYVQEGKPPQEALRMILSYPDKKPAIRRLVRVSKPGRRVYQGYRELKPVKQGMGIAIISTPRGLVTDKEARKKKIGGEVLCEIF